MKVETFTDPETFLGKVASLFARDPVSTNVIATVTRSIVAEGAASDRTGIWMIARDSVGEVVGAGMLEGAWNLFLSRMPTAAAIAIADHLAPAGVTPPGVTGEQGAAVAFASRWTEHRAVKVDVIMAELAYRLGDLEAPVDVPGRSRRADQSDLPLVADWLHAFHDEATPRDPEVDPAVAAARQLDQGDVWLWVDRGRPVAMAAIRASKPDTSRIGPVYTLPEHRQRGYAGAVTAAAAQASRQSGVEVVMLYADLANTTSNTLYRRLGFEPDHHLDQYAFL